jgi:transposase
MLTRRRCGNWSISEKSKCTTKEAAAVLDVSEPTFIDFLKRYQKAAETFERGKQNGRASLRRMQLKSAEAGNVTMLIWLGKQLLRQKDKTEVEYGVSNELAELLGAIDGHGACLI